MIRFIKWLWMASTELHRQTQQLEDRDHLERCYMTEVTESECAIWDDPLT